MITSFFGGAFFGGEFFNAQVKSEGSVRHRSSFRYDRWGKKKKQVQKKCPEVIQIIEQVAESSVENLAPLSQALARLESELRIESIKASQIYRDLLELELDRLSYEKENDEDFDDLLLL